MPAGRPSLYDPFYCQRVIELGKKGMSVVEMAADIGVTRSTLETEWPSAHPEFSEAFTRAREESQAWWEAIGRSMMIEEPGSAKLNTGIWSRSMAARFPRDWREKSETTLQGPNGGPVQVEEIRRTIVDPAKKPD